MAQTVFPGDVRIDGNLSPSTFNAPEGCIDDDGIAAGSNVDPTKLRHRNWTHWAQLSTANAATEQRVIYVCKASGGGTILAFGLGAVTAAGSASSATCKLLKNGADILSADIVLDNGTASYVLKPAAGFTSTALVAGDVLEVQISAVAGASKPVGLFAQLIVDEFPV
jgi:hypothetical protein